MYKILGIIALLCLAGVGCSSNVAPNTVTILNSRLVGQIATVAETGFVVVKDDSSTGVDEKITVTYDQITRFAEPDGSGIGGPIPKPEIKPGMKVDASGTLLPNTKPYPILEAENIIFTE